VCALVEAVRAAGLAPGANALRSLSVEGHLRVVARGDAEVAITARAPCAVAIDLRSGRVAVHAQDLQGGELRVRTDDGEVVVTGTTFAVEHTLEGMAVELAEGAVRVERPRQPALALAAGERLVLRAGTVARATLDANARDALRRELKAGGGIDTAAPGDGEPLERATGAAVEMNANANAPRVPRSEAQRGIAAPASAEALLGEADAARRAGRATAARRLYRKAAEQRGPAAEAAWLRLARLEMNLGRDGAARRALDAHRRHFGAGALAAEAAWMRVQLAQRSADPQALRTAAQRLLSQHPTSPQARAARRLLETGPAGEP
jgi:hypothetical protein